VIVNSSACAEDKCLLREMPVTSIKHYIVFDLWSYCPARVKLRGDGNKALLSISALTYRLAHSRRSTALVTIQMESAFFIPFHMV
jgi:hypothetical protein